MALDPKVAVRQEFLAEALAPLVSEIERASDLGEIERLLSLSAHAEIAQGRSDFNLMLCDGDGRVVSSALADDETLPPQDAIQTQVAVQSAELTLGWGTLTAWHDDFGLVAEMAIRPLGKSIAWRQAFAR